MSSHFIVECLDCSHQTPYFPTSVACPQCNSTWREARYDYANIARSLPLQLPGRPFDIWRYRELLPVRSPNLDLSLGEGGTPLVRAANLGMMLGCPNIYIKDERQGPTNSFKDRQAAVTISALKEAGITEMVVASTGNVAIAYSAYAARAGIKLWAFLTSLVPAAKMREVALYGTQVIKVTGSYDQAKQVAAEYARQRGIFLDQGSRTIPSVESMKTIAFEVTEQLTALLGPPSTTISGQRSPTRWRTPDWYLQSVSGGLGPLGAIKGFAELRLMGMTDRTPNFGIIQAEGCSPMVQAWKQGNEVAEPVQSPRTLIATLATGDPGRTYTLLTKKMQQDSGGVFESVSDEDAFRAMHFLAKMEGVSAEPAAAVAFAGLVKLVRANVIKPTDTVVINCTGHTTPIERNVLGQGWARNVILPTQTMEESPEEGLLAALNRVAVDRYPCICIADDNPDVRRLIRRILQSQGNYTLFEASNGIEAVEIAKKEHPDLIILDLMMPEMDGFSVMDALQMEEETMDIPVIVVTAKELTPQEKDRLKGHIQSLLQKGDFMSEEFLDEVRALIR
ncbi:MAG TPA: pyridoxal-phosphate dependent enzyme [Anaerolineaceae bacterium]|nr:pyridoxal-phosphate dependent enzyme [Anaerolineaceae bacterium]